MPVISYPTINPILDLLVWIGDQITPALPLDGPRSPRLLKKGMVGDVYWSRELSIPVAVCVASAADVTRLAARPAAEWPVGGGTSYPIRGIVESRIVNVEDKKAVSAIIFEVAASRWDFPRVTVPSEMEQASRNEMRQRESIRSQP